MSQISDKVSKSPIEMTCVPATTAAPCSTGSARALTAANPAMRTKNTFQLTAVERLMVSSDVVDAMGVAEDEKHQVLDGRRRCRWQAEGVLPHRAELLACALLILLWKSAKSSWDAAQHPRAAMLTKPDHGRALCRHGVWTFPGLSDASPAPPKPNHLDCGQASAAYR